jgi:hypothetical protein
MCSSCSRRESAAALAVGCLSNEGPTHLHLTEAPEEDKPLPLFGGLQRVVPVGNRTLQPRHILPHLFTIDPGTTQHTLAQGGPQKWSERFPHFLPDAILAAVAAPVQQPLHSFDGKRPSAVCAGDADTRMLPAMLPLVLQLHIFYFIFCLFSLTLVSTQATPALQTISPRKTSCR